MSDIPNAEEQAPSIDEIFQQFQGLPSEQQVPALAAILQVVIGQLSEVDQKFQQYCSKLDDLDKEIHEDFFGPIHDSYKQQMRMNGVGELKQKYGSKFDELAEPLKGFGVEDVYEKLYDYLEELKKDGSYNPEEEGAVMDRIHGEAMDRIGKVRGKKEEEPAEGEKPATEVAVSVEKKPSIKDKLSAGKKSGLLAGY